MSIQKELSFVLPNRPGTLGKVTSAMAAKGVNLLSLDAGGGLDHNIVRLVPSDANKAMAVLKKHRLDVGTHNVLCVKLSDKPGAIGRAATALGQAGINIEYLYATGGHAGGQALVVLRTSDNHKAQKVLKARR
jgi:hypothetical protein